MELKPEKMEQIIAALNKPPASRSYDDLLLLKYYLIRTDFMQKTLAGVANPRQLNDVCRNLALETYGAGQTVFNQGDAGDKVYILLSGACDVRVKYKIDLTMGQSELREKVIVSYDKSGQFFGERALQFDEPRSAGVVCLAYSHLITITKQNYCQILNELRNELPFGLKMEQYGTKEGVVKILSKVREKRTNQELDAVAAYLYRRIPFFQKFTMQHVVELCRVAETVTIWGRSVLFKQGQIGQAFYVILTGTVEVWAVDPNATVAEKDARIGRHNRASEVTDGLGTRVNQLVTGDCFGERALENDDSLRMASIVTGEDTTELLVLAREDYNNLVFLTMQGDSAHKLKLLRKTELFRTLDSVHLQALSKFMEPRKYQIDEVLISAGKRASEMIIIETGECRAITEVTEGYEKLTEEEKHSMAFHRLTEPSKAQLAARENHAAKLASKSRSSSQSTPDALATSVKELKQKQLVSPPKNVPSSPPESDVPALPTRRKLERMATGHLTTAKKKTIDLGRIAPNSVLASYVALLSDSHDEVYHPETIVASTLVTAFTISKHELLTHLAKDSFAAIAKMVHEHKKPVLNFLWENVPRMLDEEQWRMEKTWEKFRSQVATDHNRNVNILTTLKQLNRMHISQTSGNDHMMRIVSAHPHKEEESPSPSAALVTRDWGLPGSSSMFSERKKLAADTQARPSLASLSMASLATSSSLSSPSLHVSTLIRQRLNESHTSTEALEISASTSMRRGSLDMASLAMDGGRPRTPLTSKLSTASLAAASVAASAVTMETGGMGMSTSMGSNAAGREGLNNSLRPGGKGDAANAHMPFTLVQIHREYARSNPMGLLEQGRRHVRSYLRICGSFATCAKAKELSDTQMEQIYLTLFHSDARREKELLLQWTPFRGFEGIPVHFSDLFLIYCRSAPLEFAVLQPSKNIFNLNYPAICRPQGQRYAVIVSNRLKDSREAEEMGGGSRGGEDDGGLAPGGMGSGGDGDGQGSHAFPAEDDSVQSGEEETLAAPSQVSSRRGFANGNAVRRQSAFASFSAATTSATGGPVATSGSAGAALVSPQLVQLVQGATGGSGPGGISIQTSGYVPSSQGGAASSPTASGPYPSTAKGSRKTSLTSAASSALASETFGFGESSAFDLANPSTQAPPPGSTPGLGPPPLTSSSAFRTSSPLKGGLGGGGLHNATMNVPVPANKLKSWPLYLLECSVLYEVLATCPTRLDGLRYAMKRFGAMDDENDKVLLEPSRTASRRRGKTNVFEQEGKANTRIGTGFANKVFLRAFNAKQPDRVLKVVTQEKKLICVVPLFKWILINPETFSTLDFTRAFSESNVRKIFFAEDFQENLRQARPDDFLLEDDGSLLNPSLTHVHQYRHWAEDFREKQRDPSLVKSFSEAGFLPSYHPPPQASASSSAFSPVLPSSTHGLAASQSTGRLSAALPRGGKGEGGPSFLPSASSLGTSDSPPRADLGDDQVLHAEALKLFEREMTSKEISKQVQSIHQTSLWINQSSSLYDSFASAGGGEEGLPGMDMPPSAAADLASSQTTSAAGREGGAPAPPREQKGGNSQDAMERKLQSLSESIQSRSLVLQEHDQLYDQEHETHLARHTKSKHLHPEHAEEAEEDVRLPGRKKKPPGLLPGRGQAQAQGGPRPGRTREQELGLIQRRLDVIESLQHMGGASLLGDQRTPFASLSAPLGKKNRQASAEEDEAFKSVQSLIYATRSSTPTEGASSSHGHSKYLSPQRRQQMLAASVGPAGSAGRRVAESLRVLAESLDQQHSERGPATASLTAVPFLSTASAK